MLSPDISTLRQRNVIVDATERGLVLRIDGRPEAAPWKSVIEVCAGRALLDRSSDAWILVLTLEIEIGGTVRLFVVGEVESPWLPLTAILHTSLPGVEPFDVWGVRLTEASAPLELYRRGRIENS